MLGTGTQLFDHIAQCLALFVKDLNLHNERLPLGFTFSFPLSQHGLTKGYLVRWTKGFNCSGVVGEDVVALLEKAIAKRKVSASFYFKTVVQSSMTNIFIFFFFFVKLRIINSIN